MAYNESNDPHRNASDPMLANGSRGRVIVPSDTQDFEPYAKAIVLLTAGDVSYLPAKNADDAPLSFEGLPAGWVSPHRVRRVLDTGTDATVATVEG